LKLLINKILKVLPTVIKKGIARTLSPTYTESGEEVQSKITYTPEELQYVITVLGEQTFKIKDIEFIYNLIIKLQEDYIQQSSKK
jgi:hypothetical protein